MLSQQFFYISILNISRTVTPKPINLPLSGRTQWDLSCAIKYFAQTFRRYQQKIQKMYHFWHVNDHKTPRVNTIARQMTPFFSSTLWDVSVGIFHLCIQGFQNSIPWGPFGIYQGRRHGGRDGEGDMDPNFFA